MVWVPGPAGFFCPGLGYVVVGVGSRSGGMETFLAGYARGFCFDGFLGLPGGRWRFGGGHCNFSVNREVERGLWGCRPRSAGILAPMGTLAAASPGFREHDRGSAGDGTLESGSGGDTYWLREEAGGYDWGNLEVFLVGH